MKNGIKEKDIRDFEKACQKLSAVVNRVRTYRPNATIYATPNALHLMSDIWDDPETGQAEVLATSFKEIVLESGDW